MLLFLYRVIVKERPSASVILKAQCHHFCDVVALFEIGREDHPVVGIRPGKALVKGGVKG